MLATVFGTLLGTARLSKNFLVRKAAQVYVEFVRNVPLLGILILFYAAVVLNGFPRRTTRGSIGPLAVVNVRRARACSGTRATLGRSWSPSSLGLVGCGWSPGSAERTLAAPAASPHAPVGTRRRRAALVVDWMVLGLGVTRPRLEGRRVTSGVAISPSTSPPCSRSSSTPPSHVAEIVHGSIQAVPHGQAEAADALAVSGFQRISYMVLPKPCASASPDRQPVPQPHEERVAGGRAQLPQAGPR